MEKEVYAKHGTCEEKCKIVLQDDNACGDPECCGDRSYWIEIICPTHGAMHL